MRRHVLHRTCFFFLQYLSIVIPQTGLEVKSVIMIVRLIRSYLLTILTFIFVDADDVKNVDLHKVHNLSGPIGVEGAEPGDCLVIEILDGKCFPETV